MTFTDCLFIATIICDVNVTTQRNRGKVRDWRHDMHQKSLRMPTSHLIYDLEIQNADFKTFNHLFFFKWVTVTLCFLL